MFHAFISNPTSPPLYSIPHSIPLPTCFLASRAGNDVMLSHLSPYHAVAQKKLQGEQRLYRNPGTWVPGYPCPHYHAAAQTPKMERIIVHGDPGTRTRICPPYFLPAAAQNAKKRAVVVIIVYGNPGTRVPGYPGTRFWFRLTRHPPGRVPGFIF